MAQPWEMLPIAKRILSCNFASDQKILDKGGIGPEDIAAVELDQDTIAKEFWDDPDADRRKPPPPPPPWWY